MVYDSASGLYKQRFDTLRHAQAACSVRLPVRICLPSFTHRGEIQVDDSMTCKAVHRLVNETYRIRDCKLKIALDMTNSEIKTYNSCTLSEADAEKTFVDAEKQPPVGNLALAASCKAIHSGPFCIPVS